MFETSWITKRKNANSFVLPAVRCQQDFRDLCASVVVSPANSEKWCVSFFIGRVRGCVETNTLLVILHCQRSGMYSDVLIEFAVAKTNKGYPQIRWFIIIFPTKPAILGAHAPLSDTPILWSGVYLEEFPFKTVSAPPSSRAFTRWYSPPYLSTLKHGWGIPELNGGWMGQSLSMEDFPASHVWIPVIMSLSYVLQWCKPQS